MKKLFGRAGMTFTETLTAVLILALVTLGASAGISAAMRSYKASVELADARTLCGTLSQAIMDELRFSKDISSGSSPTYFSLSKGSSVKMRSDELSGQIVLGEDSPLIGSGIYNGMRTSIDYSYDSNVFDVELNIYASDDYGEETPLQTATFSVRPIA